MIVNFKIIVFCTNLSSIEKTIFFFKEKGYQIDCVNSEVELFNIISNEQVHLVFLELDNQLKDGITLTTEIRSLKNITQPYIIIFNEKKEEYVEIAALNAGADDFIALPMKPILLEARVSNFKKRTTTNTPNEFKDDDLSNFFVDNEQYLIITKSGKYSLPRKEFEMIKLMFYNLQKIFTRQDFAKIIWDNPEVANSRTIDIHIRNIRRTLGNDIIKTSKGVGYSINSKIL